MFISLDPDALDALRAELEHRGVRVEDGEWGYRLSTTPHTRNTIENQQL